MLFLPNMVAPVGKSGPLMYCISSSVVIFGFSICAITPSTISDILCGGMFVAMPTAMPDVPLTRRFGTFEGKTIGSFVELSKFGVNFTVFFSMSWSISSASFVNLHSV